MRPIAVSVENGPMLAGQAWATDNTFERVQGWLKKESVATGEGLLISPCASIHTFGMRFSMDAVFLDRRGKVLKVLHQVRPGRLVWGPWRGILMPFLVQVLELPAGAAEKADLSPGRRLVFKQRGLS